ncbi:unnamed protein product [Peniophora sp. CBMAI 1063]|nr:unnamed protein product [Peniophora sp. CBMAI 1063]
MYGHDTPITIGVLLVTSGVQMADIAPVDILCTVSTKYMAIPAALKAFATPMSVVYISENGASPLSISGDAGIVVTHSIQNAPKLDILVVPGPPPHYRATEAVKSFVKSTNDAGGHILSVCTGILAVAPSGVLDGKAGMGPVGLLPLMRELCPKVRWGGARRWERNAAYDTKGQVWSCGSIIDGIDEIGAFVRDHWPAEIAEPMMYLSSVPERPAEYSEMEKKWGDKWATFL